MSKKSKITFEKIMWIIFIAVTLATWIVPFVASAPPVLQTVDPTSLAILTPSWDTVKQGQDIEINWHVYNSTAYLSNDTANCTFHLYSIKAGGDHLYTVKDVRNFTNDRDFTVNINGSNFTEVGDYSYLIECFTPPTSKTGASQTGGLETTFEVTPNGQDATIGKAVFYIGLLAVLLFFIGLSLFGFVSFDNLLARVGLFGLSYLLLISITFVGWQMASDFLTSSPFIIEMFRILFFVLIVGMFPLVIGGFAWYVLMLLKIKEIERLMGKGMDRNEAEHRQGGKFK